MKIPVFLPVRLSPPALSPVRTTGSEATFAVGRVARREMILRSKRYPGVDRVVEYKAAIAASVRPAKTRSKKPM